MNNIISKRRKELGLTQQQLADKLFISDKVISKWETGKSIPDTAILVDLAKALDLSLDELLNVKNNEEKNNNISLSEMVKSKYNIISIIILSLQLISTILFWTSCGTYNEANQGGTEIMTVLSIITMLISVVLFVGSVSYFAVATNKIKAKYARFTNYDNFYFNLFVIVSAIFVTMDTLCIIYYFNLALNELLMCSAIAIVIIALIVGIIFLIKHLILKYRK